MVLFAYCIVGAWLKYNDLNFIQGTNGWNWYSDSSSDTPGSPLLKAYTVLRSLSAVGGLFHKFTTLKCHLISVFECLGMIL